MADEPNASPEPANPEPNTDERLKQLEQRYAASSEEAKRLKSENDAFRVMYTQQVQQRQDIPQRQRPEERLSELGIPVDALEEYVSNRVNQAFQPVMQMAQGRNEMLGTYGQDYNKFEADVASFVQADPNVNARYQRMFQSDPAGAMEFAFLKFGEAKRREHPAQANGVETREQQSQAQVPTSSRGGERRAGNEQQDRVQVAFERYQKNPMSRAAAEEYAKARFAQVIPDEFLYRGGR